MAVPVQGQVAPQVVGDGISGVIRLDRSSAVVVSEAHGRYYETTFRKAMFSAANSAGVTTTVGAATTYVGLCLSNPVGSPVNLVLNKVGYAFLVQWPAASTIGLMVGFNNATQVTHTTPLLPIGNFLGMGAGFGKVDSSATLPTAPTLQMVLDAGLTGAITVATESTNGLVDVEGCIILPPGGYVAFFTSTISGASASWFSMQWEEIAVTG